MTRHIEREQMAEAAHQEIRSMAQQALDLISVKVGWMIKSTGAKQGWVTRRNRKKDLQNDTQGL